MTEGGRRNRWSLEVFVMMRTDGVVGMDGGGAAGMTESWGLLNQSSAEADSGGLVGYDGGGSRKMI